MSKTWNMYNKTGDAGQNGKWDSADSADFKMWKKGWKMSGKVANGKVTVMEYSKSAIGFFEIRVANHSFWICLNQKHTCKQKYTSALFLHVNNVI